MTGAHWRQALPTAPRPVQPRTEIIRTATFAHRIDEVGLSAVAARRGDGLVLVGGDVGPRAPGPLLAIVLASTAASVFHLRSHRVGERATAAGESVPS